MFEKAGKYFLLLISCHVFFVYTVSKGYLFLMNFVKLFTIAFLFTNTFCWLFLIIFFLDSMFCIPYLIRFQMAYRREFMANRIIFQLFTNYFYRVHLSNVWIFDFFVIFYFAYLTKERIFNPLTTNIPHYIEASQLICNANQLTGFYMMGSIGR